MTYRLVVAREARSWLNALRRDDARAARLVGEAVTALLEQGPRLGPPLVVPVGAALRAGEPREALDYWYQRQLTLLMKVRQAVAEAATCRRQLDYHIGELTKQARRLADLGAQAAASGRGDLAREAKDHWSAVRHQQVLLGESRADVCEREAALLGISRRVQDQVDLFRSRRAGVEAVQRAGRAQQGVHEACGEAAGADAASCAAADGAVAKARAVACDMVAEAERLERAVQDPLGDRPPETELYELRLRALTGRDLRVLCAVEAGKAAGGTGAAEAVVLLAVAADRTQWWEWYAYALPLARKRLARRASAGREPGAEDENFLGGGHLLRGWYPGRDEDRHRGAASLIARNRGQRLASVRRHRGLTREQLAARMGVPAARVAAVEEAEPGTVEVHTLAAYVAALSGRLEIVAEFDTERLVLG
ncbi:PspA/IM30 family protein [Streptomyces chrestomyceticus]|uniref:PspA/IM30 family protein n=1 Tax=Streptomyces chrestomyceticus TaxID=68185 RepID=UPI0037A7914E